MKIFGMKVATGFGPHRALRRWSALKIRVESGSGFKSRPYFHVLFLTISLSFFATASTKAADLIIPAFDNQVFDLTKQKGKIVIVNFWASWCHDCLREMPVLNKLYQKHHEQGLEIMALNIENEKARARVQNMAEKNSYPSAMMIDAKANDFAAPNYIPVNYIIDRSGKIIAKIDGENKMLESEIAKLF